jgi:hypothetical protein
MKRPRASALRIVSGSREDWIATPNIGNKIQRAFYSLYKEPLDSSLGAEILSTLCSCFAFQMFNYVLGPALVICAQGSVLNQHLFYADPDLDPGRQSNADPDPGLSITKFWVALSTNISTFFHIFF